MLTETFYKDSWTKEDLYENPEYGFIFGDFENGNNSAKQCCIRGEKQAFSIPIGKYKKKLFSDIYFKDNKPKIDMAIKKIYDSNYKKFYISKFGICGGGVSLPELAPQTYKYIEKCLEKMKK